MSAEPIVLLAPLSGVVVPLDRVPDAAFAQRLVGDGASIDPLSDRVLAPCDGRVVQIHRANHAVTLLAHGLEIIIHVGLDTVSLKGQGFIAIAKAGDIVKPGDALLSFDADFVARHARSLLTQVVVSNMEAVSSIAASHGEVVAGRDVLLRVLPAVRASAAGDGASGESVQSPAIVVRAQGGLHARPAAMITAAARKFSADVRLMTGAREANARSVVSIMSLEVGEGDSVTVVARGSEAVAAVKVISELLARSAHVGNNATPAHAPLPARTARDSRVQIDGVLHGVAASPGVAIGNVFQFRHEDVVIEERAADPQRERRALDAALGAARAQLDALCVGLTSHANAERAAIFAAHQELLEDPELLDHAAAGIRDGASAAYAWRLAYTAQADRLVALKSDLIAGRATDLRDVGRRVLAMLLGSTTSAPLLPADSIVVAEDISPSDAAALDRTKVRGFCTTSGSATSHAAILARGLGIPAVAGIDPRALELAPGTRVILDGDAGEVRTAPTAADETLVGTRRATDEKRRAGELAHALEPATTTDGHRVEVVANIGDIEEGERVVSFGGEGVGLLRSEFLFMQRDGAPTEYEQTESYSSVARALGPDRICVIRTLDVGGDKPLSYLPIGAEANPFLGVRGVRFTLGRPDVMRAQIRAIVRSAAEGKVAIMFPMVASLSEWREARAMVEEERQSLGAPAIPIGIMIETPAAAMIADQLAREADFLSIGTNDLTQYTLAMDRTNPKLATQVDSLHPAVLRLIARTAEGAHAHERWVGVCGALAGDLDAVPVLLGLGIDELSVDVPIIPAVKARVRELSMESCRNIAREALEAENGAAVRAIVAQYRGSKS